MTKIKNTPEEIFKLNTTLEILNVAHVNSLENINKIFDIDKLMKENIVNILTDKNTVIIFDTPVYNSCYVLDELEKYVSEKTSNDESINDVTGETNILYCDDISIYTEIFKPYFGDIDENKIIPVILIITTNNSDISIIREEFLPLSKDTFFNVFDIIENSKK